MLRIYLSNVSQAAKDYFDNELNKGDYYTEYQQVAGRWGGKAAVMLSLVGDVDKDGFHALCDNLHPVTKKKLNVRNKVKRRVGYDISFHVPKSVSLLFQQSQDEAIIEVFRKSVSETMTEMESEVRTRTSVGLKKKYPDFAGRVGILI